MKKFPACGEQSHDSSKSLATSDFLLSCKRPQQSKAQVNYRAPIGITWWLSSIDSYSVQSPEANFFFRREQHSTEYAPATNLKYDMSEWKKIYFVTCGNVELKPFLQARANEQSNSINCMSLTLSHIRISYINFRLDFISIENVSFIQSIQTIANSSTLKSKTNWDKKKWETEKLGKMRWNKSNESSIECVTRHASTYHSRAYATPPAERKKKLNFMASVWTVCVKVTCIHTIGRT